MKIPRICAAIVDKDLEAVNEVRPLVDLFEVRIDLIGDGWQELVKQLGQPWIACNRRADEGGRWQDDEGSRIAELLKAVELEADIIDVELRTRNLEKVISMIGKRVKCLLSYHDLAKTPSLDSMREVIQRQLTAGADICKIVTTAQSFDDNLTILQLITEFPKTKIVSFAMGPLGLVSRVLCPLFGGDFTYASTKIGRESAPGQITVRELRKLYEMMAR